MLAPAEETQSRCLATQSWWNSAILPIVVVLVLPPPLLLCNLLGAGPNIAMDIRSASDIQLFFFFPSSSFSFSFLFFRHFSINRGAIELLWLHHLLISTASCNPVTISDIWPPSVSCLPPSSPVVIQFPETIWKASAVLRDSSLPIIYSDNFQINRLLRAFCKLTKAY